MISLKRKNEGIHPKKLKILVHEQVERLINEAPDQKELMVMELLLDFLEHVGGKLIY